jgi:hypothetical protein
MKKFTERNCDAIVAQFRNLAGPLITKKNKIERRTRQQFKKNWRDVAFREMDDYHDTHGESGFSVIT